MDSLDTANHKNRRILHTWWLALSLRQKVGLITASAAAAVFLSILLNLLIASFGMNGFHQILADNSYSLAFQSAMERESRVFEIYARERSEDNKKAYDEACRQSRKALEALPFTYREETAMRYAKTWSIKNSYEAYENRKMSFLDMEEGEAGYADKLYDIYRMQKYLQGYAVTLQQMNAEVGNERYEKQVPFFVLIPAFTIFWGMAAMAAIVWMNRSMERNLIRPVQALAGESKRIADNDFEGPELMAEGEDEIAQLIRAFYKMKLSTRGYINTLKEKHEVETRLDAVRLQMLKNQINPHFLFNTLNMIAGTAQIEDAATTEKMITAMSRLFRYNLKSTASVMPLGREIKVVEDYMYLQRMRFGGRIRCSIDCREETRDELVPVFALQPLVENAIVHGVSAKLQGGIVHIRSWMEGGRLWISVADTGSGIEPGRLKEIRMALKAGEDQKTGVGIGNIYRRLHAMYPDGELYLYSREGRGTIVQMVFSPAGMGREKEDGLSDSNSGR